ncbi:hypothetical protein [Sphingobacterium sp. BIGb0116]|uniref:hypothetical protein n=1 Tax=Sphingobacterium sp. BIGb0116 TaxID=2940619 RepID=UPI0021675572|nr:hypothetical protein [Sphingobacterium sp. BIGb0116]MCS4164240.1 hypothetical protein [Sphingobacterium sp. BIGb0116]
MKRIILTIKENWKDPVWSKVIAAVIIAIGTFILTTLYSLIKSLISGLSIENVFSQVYDFFISDISIKIWILMILVFAYLILIFKPIITFLNQIASKFKSPKKETGETFQELPRATDHSTSLFHIRMAGAFPGVRGIQWFDNAKIATKRLSILLKKPLMYSNGAIEAEGDPIWWFRGGSAMFIEKFECLASKKVLINIDQLSIKRIAAYQGESYFKDFVYVEVEAENQTGLYNFSKEDIQRHIDSFGYSSEEYGLIRNRLGWTTPIRREDYDDGATVIRGEVRNAQNAKLRVRYLSKYNFIIAAKGSPYNSKKFDRESKNYLNGILKGEIEPKDFFEFLKSFTKYEQ